MVIDRRGSNALGANGVWTGGAALSVNKLKLLFSDIKVRALIAAHFN